MKIFVNYFKPTPKKFRILGDMMLIVSAGITGSAMFFTAPVLQCAVFVGIAGKILTNFTINDNENNTAGNTGNAAN